MSYNNRVSVTRPHTLERKLHSCRLHIVNAVHEYRFGASDVFSLNLSSSSNSFLPIVVPKAEWFSSVTLDHLYDGRRMLFAPASILRAGH